MDQLNLHKKIDQIIKSKPGRFYANQIYQIINKNFDARNYFFFKADERWLDWLWKNGFLDVIKKKAKDTDYYFSQSPELNYLLKTAEKKPDKVTKIINSIKISEENFNPQVITTFIKIIVKLPTEYSSVLIKKIKNENWIYLMRNFLGNYFLTFEFKDILEKLFNDKKFEEIINLAEALLLVKNKDEREDKIINKNIIFTDDKPFYFNDVSYTKIFDYLTKIEKKFYQKALGTLISIYQQVIEFYEGSIDIYDENLFEIKVKSEEHGYNIDIKNLLAAISILMKKISEVSPKEEIKEIYQYIKNLPQNTLSWQLQLVYLTFNVDNLKGEYKKIIFNTLVKKDFISKTNYPEYQTALRIGFGNLDKKEQRYIKEKIFDSFLKLIEKEENEDKKIIYKNQAVKILSFIFPYLSKEEINKSKKIFGAEPNKDIKPEPSVSRPITYVRDIYPPKDKEKLKDLLKKIEKQPIKIETFKTLDDIYNFIIAINDEIKNNPEIVDKIAKNLIKTISNIKEAFLNKKNFPTIKDDFNWHPNWDGVFIRISDLLKNLLTLDKNNKPIFDFINLRSEILEIIKFLLESDDPNKRDEYITKSKMKGLGKDRIEKISDPFFIAINSTRGRVFESFVYFIYCDGRELKNDVKSIYLSLLEKERTRALFFLFAYYLPSFYYRDINWTKKLLPKIFLKKEKVLRLASWEGYLSQNLYKEIFFDDFFQKLYKNNLNLSKKDDPDRDFFRDPEEGIASHIALAYLFFPEFDLESELFKYFWSNANDNHKSRFIEFIGRNFIIERDNPIVKQERNKKEIIEKLKYLWGLILKSNENKKIYKYFGSWINIDDCIFSTSWLVDKVEETLKKSGGKLEWDYGLVKSLTKFAQENPDKTLSIIEKFLLNKKIAYLEDEFVEALKIIFLKNKYKTKVKELISKLLEKHSSAVWRLKEVIK